jgi:chromosome segregation ATPase
MSRTRLTKRIAAEVNNDPYTMNDTGHEKNDPKIDAYAKGNPSAWAEDVHKENPAKDDQKRETTGHAPLIDKHAAAEAIASAKVLEERAVKSIIASQRMLPGATDAVIEKQAAILMNLPLEGLNATLKNQESLAKMIVKNAEDASDDAKEKKEEAEEKKEEAEEKKEEAEEKKEEAEEKKEEAEEKKEEAEDKDASETEIIASLKKKLAKLEAKKASDDEDDDDKKDDKKDDEDDDKKDDDKKDDEDEDKDASEKEASDSNILDQIFSGAVAPNVKKGATKLSGMVKKEASSGSKDLSDIWNSSPDVSNLFQ